MSYVEAIVHATPTQMRLHRERMERRQRLKAHAKIDREIRLKRQAQGITGAEQEELLKRRREAAEERAKRKAAEAKEAAIRAHIEAAKMDRSIVVANVRIGRRNPFLLEPIDNVALPLSVRDIQLKICKRYRIGLADLCGEQRTANLVRPRQIAMYLSKKLTGRSLPEIGRRFGDRDHTTVLHAFRKIEAMTAADAAFEEEINAIVQEIEGGEA